MEEVQKYYYFTALLFILVIKLNQITNAQIYCIQNLKFWQFQAKGKQKVFLLTQKPYNFIISIIYYIY